MTRVVVDTNVLVSALLSPKGIPAKIIALIFNSRVDMCYDSRMLLEYENVLLRPKFSFDSQDIAQLMESLTQIGTAILPEPLSINFADEDDKKFYETAKTARAVLVTGNGKHFSNDPCIVSPTEFMERKLYE
ncbi:MAG: putative toxin-antitoxin system toxin component, PIN family [Oscillospiraceae bacterium]|jgi:putative PIN family toxin of toxin-antitoxin system|nr:putative toxin-antitoxin system toxin component, PIN family [Oscillospiraceae bacterium]